MEWREALSGQLSQRFRNDQIESAKDIFAWLTVIIVAGFLIPAWLRPVSDTDLGWLIWLGDQTLSGHVPRTNGFSWTAPEMPWVSHETLIGIVYAAVGSSGVALVRGIVISATALLIVAATYRPRNALAGFMALAWTFVLIDYGLSERALSWGNGMLALVTLLSMGEEGKRWRMPLAAALVGVWANMHGSFVIGILVLAVRDWRWGLAAMAATFINPYGWHLWGLILGYGAGSDVMSLVHKEIPEWTPPDFSAPMTMIRYGLLLAGGALAVWKGGWRPAVLLICLTALALDHRRFIDLAGIALAPWLALALEKNLPARPAAKPWLQLALLLPVLAFLGRNVGMDQHLFPPQLPFSSFEGKRIWNEFRLGGYLGAHGVKVFWDSRNDCYPAKIFEDGWTIQRRRPGWEQRLDHWRIETVLSTDPILIGSLVERGWSRTGTWGEITVLERPQKASAAPDFTRLASDRLISGASAPSNRDPG